jgi:hypothetical protein
MIGLIEKRPVLFLVGAIVFTGVLPHILFSALHGELLHFLGAWDEDFYGLSAIEAGFGHAHHPSRFLSSLSLSGLFVLFGSSIDAMYLAFDALFPAACLLAAYYLAGPLFESKTERGLAALFLIFGAEILSVSNLVLPPWIANVPTLIQAVPESWQFLFADNRYTFLYLFRSPEPQFSTAFLFLALGAMIRISERGKNMKSVWLVLGVTALVSPVLYGPVWIVILAAALSLPVLALLTGNTPQLARMSFVAALYVGSTLAWSLYQGEVIPSPIFESRWPLISMSVLLSVGLCIAIFRARQSFDWSSNLPWLGLACAAFPALILNQQVLTGRMIMAQVWEKSLTHYFLALGIVLLVAALPAVESSRLWTALRRIRPSHALIVGIAIMGVGQAIGSATRFPLNETSVIQRDVYFAAREKLAEKDQFASVVMPSPHTALFLTRTGHATPIVGGYAAMIAGDRDQAFKWLSRRGVTPEELIANLRSSIESKSAYPWLMMFFSPMQSWELFSNGRATEFEKILADVPSVVMEYRAWLDGPFQQTISPAILISPEPLSQEAAPKGWRNTLLAEQHSSFPAVAPAYAYLQSRVDQGTTQSSTDNEP